MEWQEQCRAASHHAQQEIEHKGTWTCLCVSCNVVRARIIACQELGMCSNCGEPLGSRRAIYCSPACRQNAYRRRQEEASTKEIYAHMRELLSEGQERK